MWILPRAQCVAGAGVGSVGPLATVLLLGCGFLLWLQAVVSANPELVRSGQSNFDTGEPPLTVWLSRVP